MSWFLLLRNATHPLPGGCECESRGQPEDVSVRTAGHGGGRTRHPKLTSSEVGRSPATGRFGDRGDTTKCAVARRSVGRDRRCPSARLGDGKKGWVWSPKVYKICTHHQVRHSSGSRHRGHEHTSCYTSLEQPWHPLSSMNRSGRGDVAATSTVPRPRRSHRRYSQTGRSCRSHVNISKMRSAKLSPPTAYITLTSIANGRPCGPPLVWKAVAHDARGRPKRESWTAPKIATIRRGGEGTLP